MGWHSLLEGQAPPILGALMLGTGLDLWQHAIHANAHIVTAFLATLCLFLLLGWRHSHRDRWLFFFCVVAGLCPVQHPLLVFAFPVYGLYILSVRPAIWRDWRMVLKMVGFALLGLSAYLYYPIRSAIGPPPLPGPRDMDTWQGFVRVVTAQGLRVNLGGFSFGEIMARLWDVRVPLSLQYGLPALALAVLGFVQLWIRQWRSALLLAGFVLSVVVVTVNVLQDAMAYLLGPVVVVGVLIGIGVGSLVEGLSRLNARHWLKGAVAGVLVLLPVWSLVTNWTRMDLSDFWDADVWLDQVEQRFVGQGRRAALLTEWERMTTVFYYRAVEGRTWDEEDLTFVYIPAGSERPFLRAVQEHIEQGPVYLTNYRPNVTVQYRLMPSGDLWRAVAGWPTELPEEATETQIVADERFEIVGWRLDDVSVKPGDVLTLDLYMRMPNPEGVDSQQYYIPWARLGETSYRFTTDRRFNTPWWQPGEIVVERFELPIPWHIRVGEHPLQVGVQWINQDRDLTLAQGGTLATLAEVGVQPAAWRPPARKLERAVGNLRGEILMTDAWVNGKRITGDRNMVTVRPGERLYVMLKWESLKPIDENYKVFVQLLDEGMRVRAQGDDKAPLRGSAPTLLWFPRWRRGTEILDRYELDLPPDLPPGQYPLVAGMYGFTSFKRVQTVSPSGDMAGDWITIAHLQVQ
jgi:hypothetical protein